MDAVYSHITFNYEKSFTLHYVYWLYVNTVDNIRWEKKSVQKSEKTLSVLHFKHRWFQQRVQLLEEIWIIPNKVHELLMISFNPNNHTSAYKWYSCIKMNSPLRASRLTTPPASYESVRKSSRSRESRRCGMTSEWRDDRTFLYSLLDSYKR